MLELLEGGGGKHLLFAHHRVLLDTLESLLRREGGGSAPLCILGFSLDFAPAVCAPPRAAERAGVAAAPVRGFFSIQFDGLA